MRKLVLALAFVVPAAFAQEQAAQPAEGAGTDPYVEFVKRAQVALHQAGFDPGPINGLNEGQSQAALAQFQLSRNIPVSGMLDEQTVAELGVRQVLPPRDENASSGAGMPL